EDLLDLLGGQLRGVGRASSHDVASLFEARAQTCARRRVPSVTAVSSGRTPCPTSPRGRREARWGFDERSDSIAASRAYGLSRCASLKSRSAGSARRPVAATSAVCRRFASPEERSR